jgi:hypothetical protein
VEMRAVEMPSDSVPVVGHLSSTAALITALGGPSAPALEAKASDVRGVEWRRLGLVR